MRQRRVEGRILVCCAKVVAVSLRGEMSELAEGARLEIVYTPKGYLGFESPSLRHFFS